MWMLILVVSLGQGTSSGRALSTEKIEFNGIGAEKRCEDAAQKLIKDSEHSRFFANATCVRIK